MRIVELLTQGSGGPADHVADVAPVLAARGHDVHVVMPDGAAASRLDGTAVVRHAAGMAHKTDVAGAAALVRLLRRLRPDVVHLQDRRAGLLGRTAIQGPGIVYTLHGAPDGLAHLVAGNLQAATERRRDRLYYLTAERLLGRRGRIVTPSEALARYLTDHVRVPYGRVEVVPNGVDTARFAPAPHPPRDPVTAVWLGLMVPVKRLDVLVAALADVPGLRAVLAGAGPSAPAPAPRVELPGFVADPAPLLAGADLFVLPSAAENCPLALLQAMASGLPVVASRVGGIPEIVRDGTDGLLVPPGDPAALAAALKTLVADAGLRERMGNAARERAVEHYSLERCADGLLATYHRVAR